MLEKKIYTLAELRTALAIDEVIWHHYRNKILLYLKEFFNYNVIYLPQGVRKIEILDIYKPYVPMPKDYNPQVEIELNKKYKIKDFLAILNISNYKWTKHREELTEWLTRFYNFILTPSYITITDVYETYYPMPRNREIMEKFYYEQTAEIVRKAPRNTGSNIGRIITKTNNKFKHKPDYAASYVRPVLKSNYRISDFKWCQLNDNNVFTEIPSAHYDYLRELFAQGDFVIDALGFFEYNCDLRARLQHGESKESLCKILEQNASVNVDYIEIFKKFKQKFGYIPIRVPFYELNIFSQIKNERNAE